jgi:hypothetical protein
VDARTAVGATLLAYDEKTNALLLYSETRLTRKLDIDLLLLEPKFYAPLRNFFQAVRTGDGEQIVLQPGEIHASH